MVRLWFDRGTLLLKGEIGTPYGKWDPRVGCFRIKALHYRDVLAYFEESQIPFEDNVQQLPPLETLKSTIQLRPYQESALNRWQRAQNRGVLVLPTAAGKTFIALKAIELLRTQTLIVVPTLDLIDQWRSRIKECLGAESGAVGGGENTVRMITVATYDSAYLQAAFLGNKFMLIVFDEVHHLASPSYMQIAEMYIAPYRMGLTATYERIDERHELLPRLIGDLVCNIAVEELAGKHLAPYTYEKEYVELSPTEQQLYDKEMSIFKNYLREKHIVMKSPKDFQRFIMITGRDPSAREALLSPKPRPENSPQQQRKNQSISQTTRRKQERKNPDLHPAHRPRVRHKPPLPHTRHHLPDSKRRTPRNPRKLPKRKLQHHSNQPSPRRRHRRARRHTRIHTQRNRKPKSLHPKTRQTTQKSRRQTSSPRRNSLKRNHGSRHEPQTNPQPRGETNPCYPVTC